MHRHKTWPAVAWLGLASLLVLLGFYGAAEGAGSDGEDVLFNADLAIGGLIFYGLMIGVSFAIASAYPNAPNALGFRRFRLRWLGIAAAVVVATTIIAVAVEPFLHGGEDQGYGTDRWQPEHAGAFVANSLVLVLLGPFAEELFFRGLGVRVLGALPPLVFFGIGLAWVRLRSASLWPSVIGHSAYNGLALLVLVLSWSAGT